MNCFFAWVDTVREPWRFLLFLGVLAPFLLWGDTLYGWMLLVLLGSARAVWLWGGRRP